MNFSSQSHLPHAHQRLPSVRMPPMRATPGPLPADLDSFAFEFRWEGYRALMRWDGRRLQLRNRANHDLLPLFPEMSAVGAALTRPLLLDGTIVAVDHTGTVDATMICARGQSRSAAQCVWDPARWSVVYVIFDLLHYAGHGLLTRQWQERRNVLESLLLHGPHWATPPVYAKHEPLMATARIRGGHGIVAKYRHGVYHPGTTSPEWVDISLDASECLIVGGFQRDPHALGIGALLLGYFATPAEAARGCLTYAGMVMTRHDPQMLKDLHQLLTTFEARKSPFTTTFATTGVVWCQPCLAVEVTDLAWINGGRFSHARLVRLRPEVDPRGVSCPPMTKFRADPVNVGT